MNSDLPIQMLDRRRVSQRKKNGKKPDSVKKFRTFLFRMPVKLAEKVDLFSGAAYRSMTAEMIRRLEASFENQSIDEHGVIVQHIPTARK